MASTKKLPSPLVFIIIIRTNMCSQTQNNLNSFVFRSVFAGMFAVRVCVCVECVRLWAVGQRITYTTNYEHDFAHKRMNFKLIKCRKICRYDVCVSK